MKDMMEGVGTIALFFLLFGMFMVSLLLLNPFGMLIFGFSAYGIWYKLHKEMTNTGNFGWTFEEDGQQHNDK